MSALPSLSITIEGERGVTDFIREMGRRTARAEILPILLRAMAPVVAAERGILGPHSRSGALEMSLKARSGGGDRPGTISVFTTPTATRRALKMAWGRGRAKQRKWAAEITPGRGRIRVFYGPMVESGHRVVRGGKVVGRTTPVHFATGAAGVLDAQTELAEREILAHIAGEA